MWFACLPRLSTIVYGAVGDILVTTTTTTTILSAVQPGAGRGMGVLRGRIPQLRRANSHFRDYQGCLWFMHSRTLTQTPIHIGTSTWITNTRIHALIHPRTHSHTYMHSRTHARTRTHTGVRRGRLGRVGGATRAPKLPGQFRFARRC